MLLVVDDDAAVGTVLTAILAQDGFDVVWVESAEAALAKLRSSPIELVISDLRLGGMDGLELLRVSRREWPDVPVVMLTAHGTVAGAVEAMKAEAADYLLKPFDREEVLFTVRKVLEASRATRAEPPAAATASKDLVGASVGMRELDALLLRAAKTNATVLLRGESGTGKELAARAIHDQSPRQQAPFIVINCGALPDALLESELFGYERGAFTGASSRKPGRVELAEGGTLFLDEIGDMPVPIQVKLLRLLQERQYEPLGGTRGRKADVRFIAATHRDLESMIAAGTFREDLFYRLNVLQVAIPPLRERLDDVPMLVRHFCGAICARDQRPAVHFSSGALDLLAGEPWPGNVRQLQNFVERLIVLFDGPEITAERTSGELTRFLGPARRATTSITTTLSPPGGPIGVDVSSGALDAWRAQAEREAIVTALGRAGGNRSVAARILGVSRRTLYNKLAEYEIS